MKIIATLPVFLLAVFALNAQTALEDVWITNNRVNQLTVGDGKVFLSGDFDWFGPRYGNGMAIFDNELVHDNSYPDDRGARLSVSDDAGGWYISDYGIIAHVKADKTIEELPFTFEGGGYPIVAMDKVGNTLYIGGQFTTVNSVARAYVAAIDLTTNTLASWNPTANGYVYSLKATGSTVYVGGSFSIIGGQTRSKIAAIDGTTGLATSWNANVSTAFGYVFAIAIGPSEVYFGGSFSNVASGVPSRRNFAAVNTTTGALTTFNPRPDDDVQELLLDGNTLYMAGYFGQVAGVTKSSLAALDVTTGLLTAFNVTFNNVNIYALALDGQKLFVGGDFLTINGTERANLAVVNKTSGVLEPMADRALSNYVLTISVSSGKVLVGGDFSGISGISSSLGCIALDENGQGVDWTPEMSSPPVGEYFYDVYLHYQNSRVYYWQDISDGTVGLGAVNSTDGAAIATWAVTVSGGLDAWAFSNNALYLAGEFTAINGTARNGFAAVDLVTGAVLPWTIDFIPNFVGGEDINSMAVFNNVLYVAGDFSFTDGGVDRNDLAAWNATTGDINPWAPEVGSVTTEIATVHDSKVYIIGSFTYRIDATTGEIDEEWQPEDATEAVNSVAVQGTSVFLAGGFSPGLVRSDITTGEVSGWQPEMEDVYDSEGSVRSIAISGTKLFVGGTFSYEIDGNYQSYFGIYVLPTPTNNQPPQILATTTAVPIEGVVTIDLIQLITDVDDNLDLSSLQLVTEFSEEGASASINDLHELILDYGGVEFFGTDYITISVCDFLAECTEQELTIEVGGDVSVYNALSPNGDGSNDSFIIQYIDILPETQSNKVTIYNRWGDIVWEGSDYNNASVVFNGTSNNGKELPSGTYFYKIEFSSNITSKSGFLSLKR